MTQVEIPEEFKKLKIPERLTIVEAVLRLIHKDLQQPGQPLTQIERKRQLAAAAEALLPDYAESSELTIFTALDSEDLGKKGGLPHVQEHRRYIS